MPKTSIDTRINLEQAVALLIRNQASFLRQCSEFEREFRQIRAILLRHEQILSELPEAIRQKIGFKTK